MTVLLLEQIGAIAGNGLEPGLREVLATRVGHRRGNAGRHTGGTIVVATVGDPSALDADTRALFLHELGIDGGGGAVGPDEEQARLAAALGHPPPGLAPAQLATAAALAGEIAWLRTVRDTDFADDHHRDADHGGGGDGSGSSDGGDGGDDDDWDYGDLDADLAEAACAVQVLPCDVAEALDAVTAMAVGKGGGVRTGGSCASSLRFVCRASRLLFYYYYYLPSSRAWLAILFFLFPHSLASQLVPFRFFFFFFPTGPLHRQPRHRVDWAMP
jgi:hypothetical protein